MAKSDSSDQMGAYTEAVQSGLYAKQTGLTGKYDNVRRYWEDEITREFIRPHLQRLMAYKRSSMQRVRIMDLGCGSADGFELLAGIRQRDSDLRQTEVDLLTPDMLGTYCGVDLNDDLLKQAGTYYTAHPKLEFRQADFTQGLPLEDGDRPFDLYFSSYGTWSHHNEDETAVKLLADIARHTRERCMVVCDWLGRYSYEWQTLWTNDVAENRNMDYVVSYIYEKEEREARRDELQHLTLRLMSRQEIDAIVTAASKEAGVEIKPLTFFDRSVVTGRHMDTAEYNPHAQPIREAVNSLHEPNVRTPLNALVLDYVPKPGFDFINEYFDQLQMCWNTLVQYTGTLLDEYDQDDQALSRAVGEIPASYPDVLRNMMARMRRVVEGVGWLGLGLPRENIIEPQLGYALRHLIMTLQQGRGCAHGVAGIFEINK